MAFSKITALPCEQEIIAVHSNSATKVAVQLKNGDVLEYSEGLSLCITMNGSCDLCSREWLDAVVTQRWYQPTVSRTLSSHAIGYIRWTGIILVGDKKDNC